MPHPEAQRLIVGAPSGSANPEGRIGGLSPGRPGGTPLGLEELEQEEALDLLAALEDSRDVLVDADHLAVLSQVEHQIQHLSRKLRIDEGGPDGY